MAIEQVLKQEVKQIKSALRNNIKRSKISLASEDNNKYQVAQVNYFKNKTKNTHIILPYGLAANPPEGEEALMFNVMSQEENTAIIPYSTLIRYKNLNKKEVRTGNPYSGANVLYRNDGVTAINGSEFEGLIKIDELTTKLNNLITEHNTHTHPETGSVTGAPSTPATSFNKADYENTNVLHGEQGTGTSGGSSGGGGGTLDHSLLINLDYAASGHIGFEKSLTFSTGLTRTGDTITTNDSQINHDALLNFLANEHIDHSGVNINTTAPLQGGGNIALSRTISILKSSAIADGYLSSVDWKTFNNKFDLPSLTSGSVLFSNGTTIAQDNTNLKWDDINKRLQIGTGSNPCKVSITATASDTYAFCTGGVSTRGIWDASSFTINQSASDNIISLNPQVNPQAAGFTSRVLNNVLNIGGATSNNLNNLIGQQLRLQFQDSYGGTVNEYRALNVLDVQDASSGSPSLTNYKGFRCADLNFATNNYAAYLEVSSGANKWNVYASGTADNYFAGKAGFGLNNPSENVHSSNKVRADSVFNVNGTDGVSGSFTTADAKTVTVIGGIITAIV